MLSRKGSPTPTIEFFFPLVFVIDLAIMVADDGPQIHGQFWYNNDQNT
jgi:hypothetical protein